MSGLLGTLTTAVRGINVQQGNISTASHNIANVGTDGYSRQRTVVQTTIPFGANSKYELCTYGQVGTGAEITDIMRIRNTFLDYQVRNEMGVNADASERNTYLTGVDDILNEVSDNGIQKCLTEFFNAYNDFATTPSSDTNRGLVYKASQALAEQINSKYTEVENQKEDAQAQLKDSTETINDLLDKINELNQKISSISALGMSANDYMDTRDLYLDDLSEQLGITVKRDKYDTISVSAGEISGINNLVNASPSDMDYTRFSYVEEAELKGSTITVTYSALGDENNKKTFTLTGDQDTVDKLLKNRMLIADKDGEVSGVTAANLDSKLVNNIEKGKVAARENVQDNIQGYLNRLDAFAASFAYTVNAIQTGDTGDGNGAGIVDKDGNKVTTEVLFTVKKSDGTLTGTDDGISAKNISVNTNIQTDLSILNSGRYHVDDYSGTKDNERAQAMYKLKDLNVDMSALFNAADGSIKDNTIDTRKNFFDSKTDVGIEFSDADCVDIINTKNGTGSNMFNYYQNIIGTIANDAKSANSDATTSSDLLLQYKNSRLQESGVSLDEEMANLVQFTHAFQANGRMINTVDKLLDVVVNGLMN
ncbi:flagellar hook-associated protein FlgK [Clostridium sp. BJN0001]|uniref:flagellar hook-associated protein FlgK n=1 Tax=Clostridium sp. BJN0001 TaxID=2930219 RepID=UPI001FD22BFA|nr:flagellar hook-associated protein FlgK [Clostridium sp. BJN0001]